MAPKPAEAADQHLLPESGSQSSDLHEHHHRHHVMRRRRMTRSGAEPGPTSSGLQNWSPPHHKCRRRPRCSSKATLNEAGSGRLPSALLMFPTPLTLTRTSAKLPPQTYPLHATAATVAVTAAAAVAATVAAAATAVSALPLIRRALPIAAVPRPALPSVATLAVARPRRHETGAPRGNSPGAEAARSPWSRELEE